MGLVGSARAPQACLRFQPGPDGLRRNGVRCAQAQVHRVPDEALVPLVSHAFFESRLVIVVVAAVIEQNGSFLVTRRPEGTHLGGLWEFPGGKIAPGETHGDALKREIREELDADVEVEALLFETRFDYADRLVSLHFYRCTLCSTPRPLLGQHMKWVPRTELRALHFPPADEELIRRLTDHH